MRAEFSRYIICVLFFSVLACTSSLAQVPVQPLVQPSPKELADAMQGMANSLLDRFDNMPSIKFLLQEDNRFYDKTGGLHALAFYDPNTKIIYVNPGYTSRASYLQMVDTVKHELIHAWVHWRGLLDNVGGGHNEAFIRKAIELQIDLDPTLTKFPEARAIYERLTRSANRFREEKERGRGATIIFRDRDPSKDEGFYGQDIFEFRFVTFSYDVRGESTVKSQEQQLYKVLAKPQVGEMYLWRDQNWRVYAITGSIVWLTEANVKTATKLIPFQKGTHEWYFQVPADMQWYAITLPRTGRFSVQQKGGSQNYAIQGSGINNSFNLPSGADVEISINGGEVLYIMATRRTNASIEIRFKLKD
jgi:hypothetical protein